MLTLAQIEQYHEDGYLIIEDCFPLEDMERLLQVARADQALADNAADRLDAQRQRGHIEEEQILAALAAGDARLHRRNVGDRLIGVNAAVGFFPIEKVLHQLLDLRDPG